ncbi:MAG: hypothetical protein IJ496_02205 [Ruminococcus sp.]|nr:hypothetical protein [Ruminococcus sp.]
MKKENDVKSETKKKTRHALSYEQTLKRLRERDRKLKAVRILLRVALVLSVLYCVWFCDVMAALGWIDMARAGENWPIHFVTYGYGMIFAAVLITAGAVLCLFGINWAAIGCGTAGTAICLIVMQLVVNYANEAGFYSTIQNKPAGAVYQDAIMPTILVCILLIALALMQFFSMDSVLKRREKKQQENAPAPKIV